MSIAESDETKPVYSIWQMVRYMLRLGAITGSVIVIARRSIVDMPTVAIALVTLLLLWRFKKLQEPVVVAAAAAVGLVVYPMFHP